MKELAQRAPKACSGEARKNELIQPRRTALSTSSRNPKISPKRHAAILLSLVITKMLSLFLYLSSCPVRNSKASCAFPGEQESSSVNGMLRRCLTLFHGSQCRMTLR